MLELTHIPLRASAEWREKTVTTDPPRYTPHTEWSLALTLVAATPVHVAVFLRRGLDTAWGLRPSPASMKVELRADFFPMAWTKSDEVQINFGWQRIVVVDRELKIDPRERVTVNVPATVQTGHVFPVADVEARGIVLEVFAVIEEDTERRRQDRWRIKPEFFASLPDEIAALTGGHQSGVRHR